MGKLIYLKMAGRAIWAVEEKVPILSYLFKTLFKIMFYNKNVEYSNNYMKPSINKLIIEIKKMLTQVLPRWLRLPDWVGE